MQKLFPPVSQAATAGSASPDTPAAQPPAAESAPEAAAEPVRPFAWPPPEEDLDDWHVFQFNETTPKPPEPPTLKLVTTEGKPAVPAEPAAPVEAPLAHLLDLTDPTLADTAELGSAPTVIIKITPSSRIAPLPDAPSNVAPFTTPASAPLAAPVALPVVAPSFTTPATAPLVAPVVAPSEPAAFTTPATAPLASPIVAPGAPVAPPAFTTPATAPLAAPGVTPGAPAAFTTPATSPLVAPSFTTPATAPLGTPAFTTPATAPLEAEFATPDTSPSLAPIDFSLPNSETTRTSNNVVSLGLSGALAETGSTLPARRPATPPPVLATPLDPPLMSATVEVITRSAQAQQVATRQTRVSGAWLRRAIVIALALLAIGEAAYILTLRLRTPVAAAQTAGVFVQSQPAGAEILIDGQLRGKAPLQLDLPPGQHVLQLRKDGVTRRFPLVLAAGTQVSQYVEMRGDPESAPAPTPAPPTASPTTTPSATPSSSSSSAAAAAAAAQVPPVPAPRPAPTVGWLLVQSTIQLSILRNGESIGNSDDGRLAVAPGHHELELSNTAAGYRESTTIQILPGQVTTLRPDLPQSTIDIESTPHAKVSIDGRAVGETPLTQVALTIGPHEILFTHPDFPERRVSTFIKVATPVGLSIDLSVP